ncbi:hypothetical protein FQA39_LY11545 [Lamprigera yunnana]|nr:hypothetical protein FQA39_LY11545 [Lamprigera yunnana]
MGMCNFNGVTFPRQNTQRLEQRRKQGYPNTNIVVDPNQNRLLKKLGSSRLQSPLDEHVTSQLQSYPTTYTLAGREQPVHPVLCPDQKATAKLSRNEFEESTDYSRISKNPKAYNIKESTNANEQTGLTEKLCYATFTVFMYRKEILSSRRSFQLALRDEASESESWAAVRSGFKSFACQTTVVAKCSDNNLFKPEVIVYMRLLIDQMLENTKKVECETEKDRVRDGDGSSGVGERKGDEERKRGPKNYFGRSRLLEVGASSREMDATNKAYVNSAIRDKTIMRTYVDMLTRDGAAAMRTHYTAYFDNANPEMAKIVEELHQQPFFKLF